MKLSLLILAAAAVGTQAVCPSLCSGHGTCGANDLCTCYANWQGKDCSSRTCAYDFAWVPASHYGSQATSDYNFADSSADDKDFAYGLHYYAECSNKGTCDRKAGLCKCSAGYEGKGCRRSSCPAGCSGHGTCETISTLAGGATYKNWDADKIQGCKCDPFYTGHDCSSRMCPKGDDPLTEGSTVSELSFTVRGTVGSTCVHDNNSAKSCDTSGNMDSSSCGGLTGDGGSACVWAAENAVTGTFTLTYTDAYGAQWETWPIAVSGTADRKQNIIEALEGLPNRVIESVKVVQSTGSTSTCSDSGESTETACEAATALWNAHSTITYAIDFEGATNTGSQDGALTVNSAGCDKAGCQPRYGGLAQTGGAIYAISVTESQAADSDYEGVTCGNRGDCDGSTGLCSCHSGYTGEACSEQTALA